MELHIAWIMQRLIVRDAYLNDITHEGILHCTHSIVTLQARIDDAAPTRSEAIRTELGEISWQMQLPLSTQLFIEVIIITSIINTTSIIV